MKIRNNLNNLNLILRRCVAFMIDLFFIYFIYFSLGVLLFQFQIYPGEILIIIKYIVIFILYHTILEFKHNQTVGMFLLKIKIAFEVNKVTFVMFLFKNIMLFIESLLLFIPCLTVFFSKKSKTLHDMLFKTYVIKI